MPNPSRYREVNKSDNEIAESDISNTKLCLLFACLVILGLICIANLVLLSVMYYVLDFNSNGLRSMTFFKGQTHVRYVLDTDFENVVLADGIISGFSDRNLDIIGDNQNVTLTADMLSTLSMTPVGTFMKTSNFKFVDPHSKKTILDFDANNELSVIGEFGGKSIVTNGIKTPKVVSEVNSDLTFRSNKSNIDVIGNEGVIADSKVLNVFAENDIQFKVNQKINTILLDGNDGIRLNPTNLPNSKDGGGVVKDAERYRLCMCTKTGLLFRSKVQDGITCAIAKENPCR